MQRRQRRREAQRKDAKATKKRQGRQEVTQRGRGSREISVFSVAFLCLLCFPSSIGENLWQS